MNDKLEFFTMISEAIKTEFLITTIGQLKYHLSRYSSTTQNSKYDHLSIQELLVMYKIDRLFERAIITAKKRDILTNLYTNYLDCNKKIGIEMLKTLENEEYQSKTLPVLENKKKLVQTKLDEHHLLSTNMNVLQVMDLIIDNETKSVSKDNSDSRQLIKHKE